MSRAGAADAWLLADVGGTNVRFALAQARAAAPLRLDTLRAYRVAAYPGLAEAARAYLDELDAAPAHAVLAVAGRVERGAALLTNHPWSVAEDALRARLGLASARLVNDFAAVAMAVPLLGAADLRAIGGAGVPAVRAGSAQTFCVLGPGTGLGVAAIALRDGRAQVLETEAGHAGFAPADEEQIAVLRTLMARFGRVSNERLLCGPGLENLYAALGEIDGRPAPPLDAAQISAGAAAGDGGCVRAAQSFARILGGVAGDCALAYGAWDGVLLAGGLLAPLAPWVESDAFRRGFDAKGRFAAAAARVPVARIVHPQPGLLGAAAYAAAASCGATR